MVDFDRLGINIKLCLIFKSFCQAFFKKRGVLLYIGAGGWRMFFGWAWYHLNKLGVFCEKTYRAALFRSLMLDFATHVGL